MVSFGYWCYRFLLLSDLIFMCCTLSECAKSQYFIKNWSMSTAFLPPAWYPLPTHPHPSPPTLTPSRPPSPLPTHPHPFPPTLTPSHPPSPLLTPWKLLYPSLVLQWTSGPCPFHLVPPSHPPSPLPTHPHPFLLPESYFTLHLFCSGRAAHAHFTWTHPGEPATCCDTPTNTLMCAVTRGQTGGTSLCITLMHLLRQHPSLVCAASAPKHPRTRLAGQHVCVDINWQPIIIQHGAGRGGAQTHVC